MINYHLTDEEIQQYALDKIISETKMAEHLHLCEDCKNRVAAYQLLFKVIKQQPEPSFGFNLTELVLSKLTAHQPRSLTANSLAMLLITFSVLLTGTICYIYRENLLSLFEGVAPLLNYLIIISAITILAVLVFDNFKNYQKKMNSLDFY